MSSTLDYSKFKSVFVDIFAQDTSLNGALWADRWGSASQFTFDSSGLTLTSTAASGWAPVGFMQAPTGKGAGEGYGLYQFTGYANAGQGTGIGFIMWRADNLALDPSQPNVATEIDVLESWDGTKTGESTIHYYNAGWSGGDGQEYNALPTSIDLTKVHTYAMDWERGSLTFYVDGVEIYQDTTHAPLDYADGGSNEVMGAELVNMKTVVKTSTVQLHVTEMEYSAPVSGSPSPTTPSTGPVTLVSGQNYAAAAGAVVQASNGSNTVTAASGKVSVTGGSGSLTFIGGTGASTVSGGKGSLTVHSGSGGGVYTGGSAGNNWLFSQGASGSNTTLTGGAAGDALFGSAAGNDVLNAGPGRDTVVGGAGHETIIGGSAASSVIFTGSGPTAVFGGVAGGDTIVGGSGSLNVTAQKGDAVFGGGSLYVSGSTNGADSIVGGTGALSVVGRGGNMLVVSGQSTSTIQTGNGASLIFAESGSTSVFGGTGWMEVVMGAGKLTVAEGGGPTTYVVAKGNAGGTDVLNGFRVGADQIDLYGYQASEKSLSVSGGSTFLNLSDGTKIQLVGVTNPGASIIG